MRKLNAWIYLALDGVVEAPENWVIPDDEMFGANETDYAAADALLLGRRTYEVFAASWPQRSSDVANADWMNRTPKFVASTTLTSLEWQNSTLIEGDVSEAISRLKQEDGKNILVNGSATLVRSLLRQPARRASTLRPSGRRGLRREAVRGRWGSIRAKAR